MSNNYLPLDKSWMTFEQLKNLLSNNELLSVTQNGKDEIIKCRKYLDKKLNTSDELFYGINTGFGFFQDVKIDKAQLKELQNNLLKSHACGLGEEVSKNIVKLMMVA